MIEISGICFSYQTSNQGKIVALRNVDLKVEEGEFLVVLGPNGCGKTTLAKHLNGLLIPSNGSVLINGLSTSDASNLWEIRRTVGYIFQNPENQIIATLVEEDVAFGPENLGLDPLEIRKRVDNSLAAVGMKEYARSEPHFLSAGQQQKIALAGVLAMQPKVIVLDEPTSMLDSSNRKEILDLIKDLNKKNKTAVVHITHFVDEAIEADRVVIMQDGKIFTEGKPSEILADPMRLRDLGVDPLPINRLAVGLARAGLNLPTSIISVKEMVKALCSLN
jgi:energy-coupling factor transport system ATP-binding protein